MDHTTSPSACALGDTSHEADLLVGAIQTACEDEESRVVGIECVSRQGLAAVVAKARALSGRPEGLGRTLVVVPNRNAKLSFVQAWKREAEGLPCPRVHTAREVCLFLIDSVEAQRGSERGFD